MNNPWVGLPTVAPFVLPEDALAISAIHAKATEETRPHTELLPEPFGGNANAPVVLVDSHPGFNPADQAVHERPTYSTALRDSLIFAPSEWPLCQLDPRFADTPPGAYSRDLFRVLKDELQLRLGGTNDEAWRHLARSVLFVHHFPYHRSQSSAYHQVESQAYGFHLVRQAVARNALIIIRNAEARWHQAVPELKNHARCCRVSAVRVPTLSRGNLPAGWFERLVEALIESPVHPDRNELSIALPAGLSPTERLRLERQIEMVVRDAKLRRMVIGAWGPACAVCGLDLVGLDGAQECEVAHIVPVAEGGPDALTNALPLCRTHHWAFDEHLWAIKPDPRTVHVRVAYRNHAGLAAYHEGHLLGAGVSTLGRDRLQARWLSFTSHISVTPHDGGQFRESGDAER